MANPDAPFGFRRHNNLSGMQPTTLREFRIANAYNTSIFNGDTVAMTTDGTLVLATAGSAGVTLGVLRGVKYRDSTGSQIFRKHWTASTATFATEGATALVEVHTSDTLFDVQSNGTTAATDIGQFVDIDRSASGDTSTGLSREQVTLAGGSETQFQVIGVYGVAPYELPCRNAAGNQDMIAVGANGVYVVRPVAYQFGIATASVEI